MSCPRVRGFCLQAEALQQARQEGSQLEAALQAQLSTVEQLTGERDACKAGAHEASDRSKVCTGRLPQPDLLRQLIARMWCWPC